MSDLERRRQLLHLGVLAFALPVPFLGARWSVVMAGVAVFANWVVLPLSGADRRLRREGERFLNGVRVYPVAVLIVLALLPLALAAGTWAVLAVGDAFSNLIGRAYGRTKLPWNPRKSWAGTLGFFVTAAPAAAAFVLYVQHFAPGDAFLAAWAGEPAAAPLSMPVALLAGAAAAAAGALAESLPTRLDDNVTVSLAGGAAIAAVATLLASPHVAGG